MTSTSRTRRTGLSINTAAAGRYAVKAPARHLRAALTALSGRLHATADRRAREAGWTVTVLPGALGLDGRSYRDRRFGGRPGR
jgi:hypothetical protein